MILNRRALLGLQDSARREASDDRSVLVVVFLRGGMDGLHAVPAYGDPDYRPQRPKLAIPPPGERNGALDLDGFFGLHEELAPLLELYQDKKLAIVHACGGPDRSLSHFEAQRNMELGVAVGADPGSGWLTRMLRADRARPAASPRTGAAMAAVAPMAAIAMGERLPDALVGGSRALVLPSLADFRLQVPDAWGDDFASALTALYERGSDSISQAGQHTHELMETLTHLASSLAPPQGGAQYPKSEFGSHLRELAAVIRADLGLRVAQLDLGNWDTHVDQPSGMVDLMRYLGRGMHAFYTDLGESMKHVTVVALSEFGRRVAGVGGLGTDHGRGGACFVLGDGIQGGKVFARWPGLAREQLDRDGNLPVTTDYRDILGEIVEGRLGLTAHSSVFPGHTPTPVGIV